MSRYYFEDQDETFDIFENDVEPNQPILPRMSPLVAPLPDSDHSIADNTIDNHDNNTNHEHISNLPNSMLSNDSDTNKEQFFQTRGYQNAHDRTRMGIMEIMDASTNVNIINSSNSNSNNNGKRIVDSGNRIENKEEIINDIGISDASVSNVKNIETNGNGNRNENENVIQSRNETTSIKKDTNKAKVRKDNGKHHSRKRKYRLNGTNSGVVNSRHSSHSPHSRHSSHSSQSSHHSHHSHHSHKNRDNREKDSKRNDSRSASSKLFEFSDLLFDSYYNRNVNDNFICSPYSVQAILSIIMVGTKNSTLNNLIQILHPKCIKVSSLGFRNDMQARQMEK